jgi:G3E family GTPase
MNAGALPGVPAVVIGGYLGAGKTTLVNELLRQADGQRIAVLVNDFGELAIDADLIVGASGDVLALAGGCVCCSFGADLIGTAQQLLRQEPSPARVLVECSGVGLPGAVARSLRLLPQLAVRGVVSVLDAASVVERAGDPYVGDTVRRQILDADRLVLNQADRCDAPRLDAVHAWLAAMSIGVPVCETAQGALPAEWLWEVDADARRGPGGLAPVGHIGVAQPAVHRFHGETLQLHAPVDPHTLAAQLAAPDAGILRAKGWVVDGAGRCWLLQVAGGRAEITPSERESRTAPPQRLLVIRARGQPGASGRSIRP